MPLQYTDNSQMPWGKYQGKRLIDIPADYFIFLSGQKGWDKTSPMGVYIESNKQVLELQSKHAKAHDKFLRR